MNMMYKPWRKLTPFLYFVKPYPLHIFGLVLLVLLTSLTEGFNIIALFGLLNMALSSGQSATLMQDGKAAYFFMKIVNLFPFNNKFISVILIFLAITIIKCFFDFVRRYFTCSVSAKIWHDVQHKVFKKCLYADYQYFLDNKEGEIVYRSFTAPAIMGATLQYSCEFLAEIVKLMIILIVLFAISLKFSAVIVIFSGLFYLFTHIIAQRITYRLGKERRDSSILQTVILTELINGIKQIKVFLSETKWLKDYDKAMRHYFRYYIKDETWQYVPPITLELLAVGLLGLLFILSGGSSKGISREYLSVFAVYAYSFYKFMPSLKNLSAKKMGYAGNLSVIESLYNFCRENINSIPDGKITLESPGNSIEFKQVNFEYPGRKNILRDLNFELEAGKTTAIVGESGSGKTTLINLILRVFVPKSGRILVGGLELGDLKLDSWLSKIGYVSQDTFIFNGSIRENIIFGRLEDENRFIEASKLADIYDFILTLPEGSDTLVGDKGMRLSGGQRQRIAIARAMYAAPEILIFDEATSSLDNFSEGLIQNSIRQISANHTVILVAHRLSTVINSDKIIVLDNGSIAEEGSHSELLASDGVYRKLYNSDFAIERTL